MSERNKKWNKSNLEKKRFMNDLKNGLAFVEWNKIYNFLFKNESIPKARIKIHENERYENEKL